MEDKEPSTILTMTEQTAYPTEVAQLGGQLVETVSDKGLSQSQIHASKLMKTQKPKCYFLETIPIEIRNHIYGYLLVNPDLASLQIFPTLGPDAQLHDFCLSPNILATCKQVNEEATPGLYGRNTFVIGFMDGYNVYTALLRHRGKLHGDFNPGNLSLLPNNKINHWRVVISAHTEDEYEYYDANREQFVEFCRFLSQNAPRSLKIWILPQGCNLDMNWSGGRYQKPTEVLRALNLFRNIVNVEIGEVPLIELPDDQSEGFKSNHYSKHKFPEHWVDEMKDLVKSNEPLARVWKMCPRLANYAQSFERSEYYKNDLVPGWGKGEEYLETLESSTPSVIGWYWDEDASDDSNNPFHHSPVHPVEEGLLLASAASEKNDLDQFLTARATVVSYLEPQYQRMSAAAMQVCEFVKAYKRQHLLFSCDGSGSFDMIAATYALLLLEEYAQSFVRDVPSHTRINIKRWQNSFNSQYEDLERENLFRELNHVLERFEGKSKFLQLFRHAMDDMDEQFLELRAARKQLFQSDDGDYEQVIDLELWKCDEMIDWMVAEPEIQPRDLPL